MLIINILCENLLLASEWHYYYKPNNMNSNSDSKIFTFEDDIYLQIISEDNSQSLGFADIIWCGKIGGMRLQESVCADYMLDVVDYRKAQGMKESL